MRADEPGPSPDANTELASYGRLVGAALGTAEDSSLPSPPDLAAYGLEVLGLVGKGGMGTVYRARQQNPARMVAVKILSHSNLRDPELLERFRREVRALSTVASPYVVPIYGAGTTPDGIPFYTMELVDGVPVEEYANRQRLSLADRLRLFRQVCEGVQTAHRAAILHRDLKPDNVLVDREGRPRILDLGLAKFQQPRADEWATVSHISRVMGTPAFMAPEQFQTDSDLVDTRADCYALGVILYRLVLETHPYPMADSIVGNIRIVCTSEPMHPRALAPQMPKDLAAILLKAIDKVPNRRYQSPTELAEDIEAYLRKRPVRARLPTTWYKVGRFLARNGLATAVALSATAVLAVSGSIAVWRIAKARNQAQTSLAAELAARHELAREAYFNSLPAIGQSVEDRDFARAAEMLARAPAEDRAWEWRRLSHQADPFQLTLGAGQELTCIANLPNGRCLTGSATGRVAVWDLDRAEMLHAWQAHGSGVRHVEVSRDGSLLLTCGNRQAKLWRAGDGSLLRTVPIAAGTPNAAPSFGPDNLLAIPAASEIRLTAPDGTVRASLPYRGKLTFFAGYAPCRSLAWCSTWGPGKADGTIAALLEVGIDGTVGSDDRFQANFRAHRVAISDDARRIAVAGPDSIRVKDMVSGSFPHVRKEHVRSVLAFMPRSHALLAGSARGLELLTPAGEETVEASVLVRPCPAAAIPAADGTAVLAVSGGALRVLPTHPDTARLLRGPATGKTWQLSPDGRLLAVADERLSVYETRTGRCLGDLGRETPDTLSFSPDAKWLATASSGRTQVHLHSLDGEVSPSVPDCPETVAAIAHGLSGQLAAISAKASLYLYNPSRQEWVRHIADRRARLAPAVLRFSPDGECLAVGTENGALVLLNTSTGDILHAFEPADYQDACFAADGHSVLAISLDTATLWDRSRRQVVGTLQPFSSIPGRRMLRFTPNGRRVVAGEHGAVSIWDTQTCRRLMREPIAMSAPSEGAFRPNGTLVLAGPDGALLELECRTQLDGSGASADDTRLRAWRRAHANRRIPERTPGRPPLVCLLGIEPGSTPGTPGAHAEELACWSACGAMTALLPARGLLRDELLARIDVLRLVGPRDEPYSAAETARLRNWLVHGGRLLLSGTGPHVVALLAALGLPRPGPLHAAPVPAGFPGTLPVAMPAGTYRLLHAARYRVAGPSADDSPVLCRPVGKGMVLAILADGWDEDAPAATDGGRSYLARGENRLFLRDCIAQLLPPLATTAPSAGGNTR